MDQLVKSRTIFYQNLSDLPVFPSVTINWQHQIYTVYILYIYLYCIKYISKVLRQLFSVIHELYAAGGLEK